MISTNGKTILVADDEVRLLEFCLRELRTAGHTVLTCTSGADALQMLAADRIPNGHTLIALQWLQIHGESLRERWC